MSIRTEDVVLLRPKGTTDIRPNEDGTFTLTRTFARTCVGAVINDALAKTADDPAGAGENPPQVV